MYHPQNFMNLTNCFCSRNNYLPSGSLQKPMTPWRSALYSVVDRSRHKCYQQIVLDKNFKIRPDHMSNILSRTRFYFFRCKSCTYAQIFPLCLVKLMRSIKFLIFEFDCTTGEPFFIFFCQPITGTKLLEHLPKTTRNPRFKMGDIEVPVFQNVKSVQVIKAS